MSLNPRFNLADIAVSIDYGLTASAIEKEGAKFLRITDLKDDDVDWCSVPSCDCNDIDEQKYSLREGDIVFARTGATTGKSYLIQNPPNRAVFASYLIRVRPNNLVLPKYLAHYFQSQNYWRQIGALAEGAAQPGVNATKLSKLEIPLPSIEEQKRIAAILDKADSLRRKRQQALQLADDFLRATYLSIVKRLQDLGHKPISLGEIFDFTTGKLDSNAAEQNGVYPFFTCSQQTFSINTYAFDCEALLLAGNNANGDYSVKHYSGKFNAYQRTYVITLKNIKNSYGFFRFALEDKLKDLKRFSKGTNTKYLTMGILNEQKMFIPPVLEQHHFESIYRKMMALRHGLSNSNLDMGLLQLTTAENLFSPVAL